MEKVKKYEIYVGGEFSRTEIDLKVINPYNQEVVGKTWLAGPQDLEDAIERALDAQKAMRDLPSYRKYECLQHISTEIFKNRDVFAHLIASESGKPLKYALSEVDRASQVFLVAAEESKRLPTEVFSIDWTPAGAGKEGMVKHFPVGLVAAIAPFNFPLNLAVHKLAPAIASGNPIIIKPSRNTPLSLLELAKIIHRSPLPRGVLSVLPMDRELGNKLVTDQRFKLLTFTGSAEVGWEMKAKAGTKKVVLELGGNASVIITPSANINLAVPKCVTGAYAFSGQVCIHLQRIFVHESLYEQFLSQFIEKTKSLKVGNPLDVNTDVSVMIDEENASRVEEWIEEAELQGATIVCGGRRLGCFVEPTVLSGTLPDMKVRQLEVFGPVVCIERYVNFDDAIRLSNDTTFGLQAGIFTNEIKEMNQAYQQLEFGGVIVNDVPSFRVDHMPYGGVKNSGFGREGVKYAIQEMMEPKLLVRDLL